MLNIHIKIYSKIDQTRVKSVTSVGAKNSAQ